LPIYCGCRRVVCKRDGIPQYSNGRRRVTSLSPPPPPFPQSFDLIHLFFAFFSIIPRLSSLILVPPPPTSHFSGRPIYLRPADPLFLITPLPSLPRVFPSVFPISMARDKQVRGWKRKRLTKQSREDNATDLSGAPGWPWSLYAARSHQCRLPLTFLPLSSCSPFSHLLLIDISKYPHIFAPFPPNLHSLTHTTVPLHIAQDTEPAEGEYEMAKDGEMALNLVTGATAPKATAIPTTTTPLDASSEPQEGLFLSSIVHILSFIFCLSCPPFPGPHHKPFLLLIHHPPPPISSFFLIYGWGRGNFHLKTTVSPLLFSEPFSPYH
jgi:hypothetical protein